MWVHALLITNPALRSRENFVLCFANIVLCLVNIVLCLEKCLLCSRNILCFKKCLLCLQIWATVFRLNFRPRSGQASDEVMRGPRAFWKVQKAFSGMIFSILFRASN